MAAAFSAVYSLFLYSDFKIYTHIFVKKMLIRDSRFYFLLDNTVRRKSPAVENRWFVVRSSSFQQVATRHSPAEPIGSRAEPTAKHSETRSGHDMVGGGFKDNASLIPKKVNNRRDENFRCCEPEPKFCCSGNHQTTTTELFSLSKCFPAASRVHGDRRRDGPACGSGTKPPHPPPIPRTKCL